MFREGNQGSEFRRQDPASGAPMTHRVVILGGGFGGLNAAQSLAKTQVDVTVIDRRNFHLFQPLLYQVATGALSGGEIASPIRWVLRKQNNATVLLAEAIDVDIAKRRLLTDIGP